MSPSPSIGDSLKSMFEQSKNVLSKPSVPTFEQYENQGTVREAIIYVAVAALIAGIVGLGGGLATALSSVLGTVVGFLIFTYLLYYVGKTQGGTGTFDHVAYTFALFWAPLSVLFSILMTVLIISVVGWILVPFVAIASIAANIYFAYLAIQSSMNLHESSKIWLTLIAGAAGSIVLNMLLRGLLG